VKYLGPLVVGITVDVRRIFLAELTTYCFGDANSQRNVLTSILQILLSTRKEKNATNIMPACMKKRENGPV